MTRVLFLESGVSGGGSFESLVQYLSALDRGTIDPVVGFLNRTEHAQRVRDLGMEVHFLLDRMLTATKRNVLPRCYRRASVWAKRLSPALEFQLARRIHAKAARSTAALIREVGAELLYLNTQISRDMYGVFAAQASGLPCVSHLRSMDGRFFTAPKAALANKVVTRFVANSKTCRRYWIDAGLNPEAVEVIYNAVPPMHAAPLDLAAHWPRTRGASHVVGCVGRLVELKGQHLLLRAFALLRRTLPKAVLLLVGDGPERQSLESLAAELGIADSVVFTGFETRAKAITAALDLLVLPSRYDAMGRVLLEGMALGVPVLGADMGGIPEVITHGEDGLLVPYGDEAALASAMADVLTDQALRQRLVRGGHETVQRRFSMAEHADRVTNVILETLGRT